MLANKGLFRESNSSGTISFIVGSSSPTLEKIRELAHYKDGWRFGDGVKFSKDVIKTATWLHLQAVDLGFLKTGVFPGLAGELIVTVYKAKHCLEFTINSDLNIDYVHEIGDGDENTDVGLSIESALTKMMELRDLLCYSLDYFDPMNLTVKAVDLEAQPFKSEETGGFPLSIGGVLSSEVLVFANT